MITTQEREQDAAASTAAVDREQEITNRLADLGRQTRKLQHRASHVRRRLEHLDPASEATAELVGELQDLAEDMQWIQYGLLQLAADALATVLDDGEVIYNYSPADVKAWLDRAEDLGATRPQIQGRHLIDLVRLRLVPNAPFRTRLEEVAADGRSDRDVAGAAHYELVKLEAEDGADYGSRHLMRDGNPQARHMERLLGVTTVDGGASPSVRLFIPYKVGVALMRALNMTPQEAGL